MRNLPSFFIALFILSQGVLAFSNQKDPFLKVSSESSKMDTQGWLIGVMAYDWRPSAETFSLWAAMTSPVRPDQSAMNKSITSRDGNFTGSCQYGYFDGMPVEYARTMNCQFQILRKIPGMVISELPIDNDHPKGGVKLYIAGDLAREYFDLFKIGEFESTNSGKQILRIKMTPEIFSWDLAYNSCDEYKGNFCK